MPTIRFDCQLLNETAEMSYPVFSQTRENMHTVEKDGYHFEGAPLGDRSMDRTIFFEWENIEGSEARLKSGS